MPTPKPQSLQDYMTVPKGIDILKKFSKAMVRYLSMGEVSQLNDINAIFKESQEFRQWAQKWLTPQQEQVVAWVGKSLNANEWEIASQFTVGKTVERSNNPVHNWTLSRDVAKEYATGSADKSQDDHVGGYIGKQNIAKNDILLAVNNVAAVFGDWKNSEWGNKVITSGSEGGKEFMKYVISMSNVASHFEHEQEILVDGKVHSSQIAEKF